MKNKLNHKYISKLIAVFFAGLMVTAFPLYLTDGYFNIRHDKLNLFYILSSALILLTAVSYIFFDKRSKEEKLQNKFKWKSLSVTDVAVLAFGATAVISTLLSDYKYASLTGVSGRNNGMVLVVIYVVVYFIVSRNYSAVKIVPVLLCIISSFVAVLAVVNQFYWDPFNIYDGLSSGQFNKFLSTIGNRNILSGFLCLTFPVPFVSFVYSKKFSQMLFNGICTACTFAGVLCSNSDGSVLGVSAFLLLFFLFLIRNIHYLSRLFALVGFMIVFSKLISFLSAVTDDYSMGFGKLQSYIIYGNTYIIFVALILISALLFLWDYKKPKCILPKLVQIVAIIIFALALAGAIGAVVYYSFVNTEVSLTGYKKYFRFDDAWGTHRGFMWIRAFYIFGGLNIVHKIFGTGADTFKLIMDSTGYNNQLFAYKRETTDCAHNVYLNYLVTLGISGTASYIVAVISPVVRAVKNAFKSKYALIFAGGVVCYSIQALVNIDQPITTPLLVLFIALVENRNREV
jgi:O-antigen ligase